MLPAPKPRRGILVQIWQATIWAKGAIPADEHKYRNLKRVLLPGIDVGFFLAGWAALVYGVPAINEFFPVWVVQVFAIALSGSALVCLLGVSFPRLWGVELVGKSVIVGLLSTYILALLFLTQAGDGNRGFVFAIALVAALTPLWRITLIANERQYRQAHERAAERLERGL